MAQRLISVANVHIIFYTYNKLGIFLHKNFVFSYFWRIFAHIIVELWTKKILPY